MANTYDGKAIKGSELQTLATAIASRIKQESSFSGKTVQVAVTGNSTYAKLAEAIHVYEQGDY